MKTERILEMINNGEIAELKQLLQNEVYSKSLGSDGKKRYSAMKRYYKFTYDNRVALRKINLLADGRKMFVDGYTFAITSEDAEGIPVLDPEVDHAQPFKIDDMLHRSKQVDTVTLDICDILAEAKSKGYKFTKAALQGKEPRLLRLNDAYFNIALLNKAYSIIDDGEPARVYYNGPKSLLLIETSVGCAGVLPLYIKGIVLVERCTA